MTKVAIITDSTAQVPAELAKNPNLYILSIPVILDGKPQSDQEIDPHEFYKRLEQDDKLPTTSQPSMGELIDLYEELIAKGYEAVINIHLSSGISGFIQHLTSLAPTIKDLKIYPFDSLSTSVPMLDMVEQALKMIDQGKEPSEILATLHDMRENRRIYIVVDDLKHLVRGGRLRNGTALIGSLLNIKPILQFDDEGRIVLFDKIRSAKKAYKRGQELSIEHYKHLDGKARITIAHTDYEDKAKEIAAKLSEELNIEVDTQELSIIIGTHIGAKAIGFAISKIEE